MNCTLAQNRLLAVADPQQVAGDLRLHVSGCAACRAFAAKVKKLDAVLANLPVPASSPFVKATFLNQIVTGPVITRVPVVPKRDSAVDLLPALVREGRWKYVSAGIAAGVLIATGWFAFSGKKPTGQPEPMARKHDLLNKQVQTVASLAKADTPQTRLTVWSAATDDLRAETKLVYKHADDDEMKALARMMQKVVYEGLLKQAERLNDKAEPAERKRLLTQAVAQLTATEAEAEGLSQQAPPHSQKQLQKMAAIARDGRTRIELLLNQGA